MVNFFTDSIIYVLHQHAPLLVRRKTKIRRPCPWLTKELVHSVMERNRLHHCLMLDLMNDVPRQEHIKGRARARRMDRWLRNAYFLFQCYTSDQQKRWRVMNTVSGRLPKRQEPKASMVDRNRLFENVVTDASHSTTLLCPEGPAHEHDLPNFHLVTIDDVRKCLCSVDPNKAVGGGMIPGLVLKSCGSVLVESLIRSFNDSLIADCVPTAFKMSHVSPLY